jgi:hypothetical protein
MGMNNSYMPAMPTTRKEKRAGCMGYEQIVDVTYSGLTKREYLAGLAMQGLLASIGQHDVTDYNELASDASMAADALLKELEK